MTDLLYYDDAYLKQFDAQVTRVVAAGEGKLGLVLDRTAFYPGGGGQPADTGNLTLAGGRLPVSQIKRESGEIVHIVELGDLDPDLAPGIGAGGETAIEAGAIPAGAVQAGTIVQGELDWPRRYAIMRTHTAMHILCGVVWRDYGASVTGGNMEPGEGRMDFEFESLSRDLIGEIEAKCNAEIAAAHPVTSKILPRDEAFAIPDLIRTKINLLPPGIAEVRTVELEGLDLQADGGTHVENTREVGTMKIVDYKSKGAINKRIYIKLES